MSNPQRKARGKAARMSMAAVRAGGATLQIPNSGLEVWLYDESNRERIRRSDTRDTGFGGMPPRFEEQTRSGLVIGYSLLQDDDIRIAVYVGPPLSDNELAAARWLEPQHALIHLPSGKLCVESNDASRIGPEEPSQKGAVLDVPPGAYRLTLYRIDREALDREGLAWQGAQEVIVLTPGGTEADAASELLPFQPRRDTAWIGQYVITAKSATALVWFGDYWDTFVLNLDAAGVRALGADAGAYLRTHVPTANVTLVTVYAGSWEEARRIPPPADVPLDEYGCCALTPMADWNGAQALFCRRDRTKTRIEVVHHNVWLPATVEVLKAQPAAQPKSGQLLYEADLRSQAYFDASFLSLILSDVLPEVANLDELELPGAIDLLDRKLATQGLRAEGDVAWQDRVGAETTEHTCRFYVGLPDTFAAILAAEGVFVLIYMSELENGEWIVTGLADDIEHRINRPGPNGVPTPHTQVRLTSMDAPLKAIFAAHRKSVRAARIAPAPTTMSEASAAWERFLVIAFGTRLS